MTRLFDGLLFGTTVLLAFVGIVTVFGWIYDHLVRPDMDDQDARSKK